MSVIGYPTPGKQKARQILDAFCAGIPGAGVVEAIPERLRPGAAAFYGITPATVHLWHQALRECRDWYYIDNAYFDHVRGKYFRVTRNRLQHCGGGISTGRRLEALGLEQMAPCEPTADGHVLLCPQSDEFMRVVVGHRYWLGEATSRLRELTGRELRVRHWQRNKAAWYRTLPADLRNCHALVTWSSAASISAMLAGVPAFVLAEDCIARPVANNDLASIETPSRVDDNTLRGWLEVVADNQWTLDEMRGGLCWEMLNAQQPQRGVVHDSRRADGRSHDRAATQGATAAAG